MQRGGRAFTLVEVLVVLAIIGLLSAIIFPVLARSKSQGKNTETISNLSQLGLAVSLYNSSFDNYYPLASSVEDKNTKCSGETPSELPVLQDVMKLFVADRRVWRDSLDTGVPNVAVADFTEPIECELPGTQPTLFGVYGSSFTWRADLGEDHVADPFELIEEGTNNVLPQSQVAIMRSAYGNWRGGPDVPSKRVSALFGDGHVRIIPMIEASQQGAFRSPNKHE
jgi:prepilin-type N-terminal cleavage/methylation domain-containing protein/prepilin-type processing-associated H-X9-DG protein